MSMQIIDLVMKKSYIKDVTQKLRQTDPSTARKTRVMRSLYYGKPI